MLLNLDLSHEVRLEVNLAKKEKKRKLREWEVNEIFEDNKATKLPWAKAMVGSNGNCIWLSVKCVHKLKGEENEPCSQIQQPPKTC
jgi:hypothetical protein